MKLRLNKKILAAITLILFFIILIYIYKERFEYGFRYSENITQQEKDKFEKDLKNHNSSKDFLQKLFGEDLRTKISKDNDKYSCNQPGIYGCYIFNKNGAYQIRTCSAECSSVEKE